jgi:sugar/nucleoside kinase (ribokinase family)
MTVPIVVGTGLVALDVVFRGPSKKPLGRYAGGTCGNVLIALRYLGWKAIPVARLADDRARRVLEADLVRWGVDVRFLGLLPHAPTPIIVERILANRKGTPEHRFSWTCPCCGAWLPKYKPVLASAVAAVTDDVTRPSVFFFDRPSRGALNLAKRYAAAGSVVVFEPSASSEPGLFDASIEAADVIKYSDQRLAAIPEPRSKKRRLEIQTMGGAGLRYRIRQGRRGGSWHALPAIHTSGVVDTAGAGDWCTAGFLARLGGGGIEGIDSLSEKDVRDALRYGQALSAWNCRFEGARGGMYERSREEFSRDVAALLEGADQAATSDVHDEEEFELDTICPACPADAAGVTRSSDIEAPTAQRSQ